MITMNSEFGKSDYGIMDGWYYSEPIYSVTNQIGSVLRPWASSRPGRWEGNHGDQEVLASQLPTASPAYQHAWCLSTHSS